jgi:hypothetical protein
MHETQDFIFINTQALPDLAAHITWNPQSQTQTYTMEEIATKKQKYF